MPIGPITRLLGGLGGAAMRGASITGRGISRGASAFSHGVGTAARWGGRLAVGYAAYKGWEALMSNEAGRAGISAYGAYRGLRSGSMGDQPFPRIDASSPFSMSSSMGSAIRLQPLPPDLREGLGTQHYGADTKVTAEKLDRKYVAAFNSLLRVQRQNKDQIQKTFDQLSQRLHGAETQISNLVRRDRSLRHQLNRDRYEQQRDHELLRHLAQNQQAQQRLPRHQQEQGSGLGLDDLLNAALMLGGLGMGRLGRGAPGGARKGLGGPRGGLRGKLGGRAGRLGGSLFGRGIGLGARLGARALPWVGWGMLGYDAWGIGSRMWGGELFMDALKHHYLGGDEEQKQPKPNESNILPEENMVFKSLSIKSQKDLSFEAQGVISLKSKKDILLEAQDKISLKERELELDFKKLKLSDTAKKELRKVLDDPFRPNKGSTQTLGPNKGSTQHAPLGSPTAGKMGSGILRGEAAEHFLRGGRGAPGSPSPASPSPGSSSPSPGSPSQLPPLDYGSRPGGGSSIGNLGRQRGGGAGGTPRPPGGGGSPSSPSSPNNGPPGLQPSQGANPYLADRRAQLMKELEDPRVRNALINVISHEASSPADRLRATEALFNRALMNNQTLWQSLGAENPSKSFFGPVRRNPGLLRGSPPSRRNADMFNDILSRIGAGSNTIDYRTDQGLRTDPGARRYQRHPDRRRETNFGNPRGNYYYDMGQRGTEWAERARRGAEQHRQQHPDRWRDRQPQTNRSQGRENGYGADGRYYGESGSPSGRPITDEEILRRAQQGQPLAGQAVDRAMKLLGANEHTNRQQIAEFLRKGGHGMNPAQTAWCAAFVGSALEQMGMKGTKNNVARSYNRWGRSLESGEEIRRGDVMVTPGRGVGGHVGFATGNVRRDAQGRITHIEMYSGNTTSRRGGGIAWAEKTWVRAGRYNIRRATLNEYSRDAIEKGLIPDELKEEARRRGFNVPETQHQSSPQRGSQQQSRVNPRSPSVQQQSGPQSSVTQMPRGVTDRFHNTVGRERSVRAEYAHFEREGNTEGTSVHEAIHAFHDLNRGYYSPDGKPIPFVNKGNVLGLPRPDQLLGNRFERDEHSRSYVYDPKAASAQDIHGIFDELSAYITDQHVQMESRQRAGGVGHVDAGGFYAQMAFLSEYVNRLSPEQRNALNEHGGPSMRRTIENAEIAMQRSAPYTQYAEDMQYRRYLMNPENRAGLREIMGRPINIPDISKPYEPTDADIEEVQRDIQPRTVPGYDPNHQPLGQVIGVHRTNRRGGHSHGRGSGHRHGHRHGRSSRPRATSNRAPGGRGDWGNRLMRDLQRDLNLTRAQAAGMVGNFAHESANFRKLQEMKPLVPGSRGGYGIAQWTGKRRRDFEAWAKKHGLETNSYEANYGFLKHELTNTSEKRALAAIRKEKTAAGASESFMNVFERPGIKHLKGRQSFAEKYFDSSRETHRTARMTADSPGTGGTPNWSDRSTAQRGLYDAFRKAGFNDMASRAMVAEVGRENSYRPNLMFGSHSDPHNRVRNSGIFSWQGSRNPALMEHLSSRGVINQDGRMMRTQDNLNAQAEFVRQEMKQSYKGVYNTLMNDDVTYQQAHRALGTGYIRWRYNDPKYAHHHRTRDRYFNQVSELVRDRPAPQQQQPQDPPTPPPVERTPQVNRRGAVEGGARKEAAAPKPQPTKPPKEVAPKPQKSKPKEAAPKPQKSKGRAESVTPRRRTAPEPERRSAPRGGGGGGGGEAPRGGGGSGGGFMDAAQQLFGMFGGGGGGGDSGGEGSQHTSCPVDDFEAESSSLQAGYGSKNRNRAF